MVFKNESIVSENVGAGVSRKIIASGGSLMTVEVFFEKGSIGTLHKHTHEQASYIIKGSFEFELEGKKQIIKAGDSYYVAPDLMHGVVALEDSIILDIFTPQREDFLK